MSNPQGLLTADEVVTRKLDFTSIHRRLVVISHFGEQEEDVFNILSKTGHCAETGGILMQQETAGSVVLRITVFTSRLFTLLPVG